jgi:hypothetical protein
MKLRRGFDEANCQTGKMLNCLTFCLDGEMYTFLYPLDARHPDPPQPYPEIVAPISRTKSLAWRTCQVRPGGLGLCGAAQCLEESRSSLIGIDRGLWRSM